MKAAVTQTVGSAVELAQGRCSTIRNPKPSQPLHGAFVLHTKHCKWVGGSKVGQPYGHACGAGNGAGNGVLAVGRP